MNRLLPVALVLALTLPASAAEAVGGRLGPPAWLADSVAYHLDVDRFRNGDPANDPRPADLRGAAGGELPKDWRVTPWGADWYALQPWEKVPGRDFYGAAVQRRYGGDLQGIFERLDYLQSLGVNLLVLGPVFEAPSARHTDSVYWHHVDNNLGPDPEGDRLAWATENPADPLTWKWTAADRLLIRLVKEAHVRGMRVALNVAFDHVGVGFWAFRDVRIRGRASRYADWFSIARFDDPKTAADDMDYATAFGVREMPALRRQSDSLAPGVRDHALAALSRWIDPNGDGDPGDGVDGWRLLDADRLPMGFIREVRRHLLSRSPDAVLLGDVFWEDREQEILRHPLPWLRGDTLDAVTQHRWSAATRAFILDRTATIDASEYDGRTGVLRAEVPWETTLAQFLALGGPDTERVASQAVNPDRGYDRRSGPREDPAYEVRAPRPDEARKARLAAVVQLTSPGVPLLWYGDEAGLVGADDPDCHKPMLWKEIPYEDEASHPLGQKRPRDKLRVDEDLVRTYQVLGRARAALPALRRGTAETLFIDDARRLVVVLRSLEDKRVICAYNASDRDTTVDVAFDVPGREVLTGRRLRPREGRTTLTVPAQGAAILVSDGALQP